MSKTILFMQRRRSATCDGAKWDESKHKRDNDGKFSSTGSGGGKKDDKSVKPEPKKSAGKKKAAAKQETGGKRDTSLSPNDYWDKYHEPKPNGVYGNKVLFDDGNFSFRSREIELPKEGVHFDNADEKTQSDMRAILKGLAKKPDSPAWKEVAERFLPVARRFYGSTTKELPFTRQDLSWCESHLKKLQG